MCQEFCSASVHTGSRPPLPPEWTPPQEQTPPRVDISPSRHPPGADTHPGAGTPLGAAPRSRPRADTPPGRPPEAEPPRSRPPRADTPPRSIACWEIRSMRGRYASYWNAILFMTYFHRALPPPPPVPHWIRYCWNSSLIDWRKPTLENQW